MSLFLVGNIDVKSCWGYFSKKEKSFRTVYRFKRNTLQSVRQTDSLRMEVSSPKLAVAIRGNGQITELVLSLQYFIEITIYDDVWLDLWSFSKVYETGKLDASLSWLKSAQSLSFWVLTMDTQEACSLSHQFRKAIRQFSSDTDITEGLDLVKSEMFEIFSSMNSLEFIATQYVRWIAEKQF